MPDAMQRFIGEVREIVKAGGSEEEITARVAERLRPAYDCLVFHATGTGGRAMEKLADSGMLVGLVDVTTTEVCDLLLGGVLSAGEGRLDASTVYNKAPVGVARRAAPLGIPVIALAGNLGRGFEAVYDHGITAAMCIVDRPLSMRVSVDRTSEMLASAAERAMRLLAIPNPASRQKNTASL